MGSRRRATEIATKQKQKEILTRSAASSKSCGLWALGGMHREAASRDFRFSCAACEPSHCPESAVRLDLCQGCRKGFVWAAEYQRRHQNYWTCFHSRPSSQEPN